MLYKGPERCEFLTEVLLKILVMWDVTTCPLVKFTDVSKNCVPLSSESSNILGLTDPEDGNNTILRSVGIDLQINRA